MIFSVLTVSYSSKPPQWLTDSSLSHVASAHTMSSVLEQTSEPVLTKDYANAAQLENSTGSQQLER